MKEEPNFFLYSRTATETERKERFIERALLQSLSAHFEHCIVNVIELQMKARGKIRHRK